MVNNVLHGRPDVIHGMNLSNKDGESFGPAALRFAKAVSFFAADGSRNRADGSSG